MRKKIDYKLEYRDKGKKESIKLEIDFASNRVVREFSDLILQSSIVEKAHNRISDIHTILAGEDLNKEEIEKLEKEIEECNSNILEFNNNGYLEKRFDVLKRLLVDNGYGDNEMLMSFDFWDESVEPGDLIFFMYRAIFKDIDNKKKAQLGQ